jgi:hypothetical protein
MARGLKTVTIKQFKGLNCWDTLTNVGEEWAIDCMNVIPSGSGGLEKLRYPISKSVLNADVIGAGNIFNYQNALGIRQVLAMFGDKFYSFAMDSYVETLRDTNALNVGILSAVCSNNIAFMANGLRMMKWDGTNIFNWGISQAYPPQPSMSAPGALTDPTMPPQVVFSTYSPGLGARTYAVTYTWIDANGGETLPSPATTLATAFYPTVCGIKPAAFPLPPASAVGWNAYVDIAGGANRRRMNTEEHGGIPMPLNYELWERHPTDFSANMINPVEPGANTSGAGQTLAIGRRYRVAYGNAVGHIGAASQPSNSTGAVAAQTITVIVNNPTDPQCDRIFLFATEDGGSDYYLMSNIATSDGSWPLTVGVSTSIEDGFLDADLNTAIIAPLLNFPPPVAKYVCEWGGRIFAFNLAGYLQDIVYSGYERIYIGRPEESFPPNNRLRLAMGADEIRGGGVIQAGVVAFSKSNEMFMLRGEVEDKSTDAPIQYSAVLDKLPWNTGCASHFSIVKTPYGLAWLASDKTIKIFNGTDQPTTLAAGLLPILRSITPGTEEDARGIFYCFLEREWYLLLCAVDGSTQKNRILIVDLEPDKDANVGAFPLQIEADAMEIVEDSDGISHLIIAQDGILKELIILSDTTGGISLTYTATANMIPARWRSGYFGNDSSEWMKIFRYGRLVVDQLGFSTQIYLVNDEFRFPDIMPFSMLVGDHIPINRKAKRASIELKFPEADTAANVIELSLNAFLTSQR